MPISTCAGVDGLGMELEVPRSRSWEKSEQVVQELGQHPAGGEALIQELGVLGVEVIALDQLQHAQHAVHGRSDLVADVGEEAGFGFGGDGRLPLGLGQGQLLPLSGVDVLQQADGAAGTTQRVVEDLHLRADPAGRSVRLHQAGLQRRRTLGVEGGDLLAHVLDVVRMHVRPDADHVREPVGAPGDGREIGAVRVKVSSL